MATYGELGYDTIEMAKKQKPPPVMLPPAEGYYPGTT